MTLFQPWECVITHGWGSTIRSHEGKTPVRVNYQTNATIKFEVLTEDQREDVFRSALEIMEDPGIDVHNEEVNQSWHNICRAGLLD